MAKDLNEELGIRHRISYREDHLYAVVTGKSLTLTASGKIFDLRTLTGLDIIAGLVTLLLEAEVDVEKIGGRIWEASRTERDLAAQLSRVLVEKK
jgi:hypothetical protein